MLKKLSAIKLNLRNFSTLKCKSIGFIGAPFSEGQPKRGTELAPDAMRKHGLINILYENNYKVNDYGDLKFEKANDHHPKIKNLNSCLSACKQLSEQVHRSTTENDICLTIGGDHSLGFGTVHGHSRTSKKLNKKLAVLWIDAHADANSVQSTISGKVHG